MKSLNKCSIGLYLLIVVLLSCQSEPKKVKAVKIKEFKEEVTTSGSFSISVYDFEIKHRIKIRIKTGEVIEESIDTILTNLCDFCSEEGCCEYYNDPDPGEQERW